MEFELLPVEARILGALLEKALTTPDNYPLTLAALTTACNQKSNREPVMELEEATVLEAVEALARRHLVRERSGAGSRVVKYAHRLSGNLDAARDLSEREQALVALLLLRGPQTVGELRNRSRRMADFDALEAVETTLLGLVARDDGPWVMELPRQPGQRERRFMHLLGDETAPRPAAESAAGETSRLTVLEAEVAGLRDEVAALRQELAALREGWGG